MSKHTRKQNVTAICYDRKGRVLSVGKNSYIKTHPLQARAAEKVGQPDRVFLHAEIAALVKVKDWNKIHRMIVVRLNRKGQPLNAKPCAVCASVIEEAGINIVEHT